MTRLLIDGVPQFSTINRMHNRIKELRIAKGWSMRELASRANTSASTINKLEKGVTSLNTIWMERLGKAFGVEPEKLLRNIGRGGFENDAVLYTLGPDEGSTYSLTETQFLYQVKTSTLDQLGIVPGDVLTGDISPAEMSTIKSEDIVIAQLYEGMTATTILRQFITPSLLITNSASINLPSINLRTDDAGIKAVVISSHSRFRKNRAPGLSP